MASVKRIIDEGIENLEKGAVAQVKTTAQSVVGQLGVSNNSQNGQSDQGTSEAGSNTASQAQQQSDQAADQAATKETVKSFYAPSDPKKAAQALANTSPSQTIQQKMDEGMSPEDAAKYEALKRKLHEEGYYVPLTQRKSLEEEHKEEEQEKEEEKMEELQLEDKKKKQDDDIAIKQSQQKTEKFPGASG